MENNAYDWEHVIDRFHFVLLSPHSGSGSSQVENIQPFTAKELSIRSLADFVLDMQELEILYRNRPKREAFRSQSEYCEGWRKAPFALSATCHSLVLERHK